MLQDTVNQGRAAELARDQKRGISTGPQPRLERSPIQMEVLVKKLDRKEERRQGSIWQHELRYSEGGWGGI